MLVSIPSKQNNSKVIVGILLNQLPFKSTHFVLKNEVPSKILYLMNALFYYFLAMPTACGRSPDMDQTCATAATWAALQGPCRVLNPLCHQGTPPTFFWYIITDCVTGDATSLHEGCKSLLQHKGSLGSPEDRHPQALVLLITLHLPARVCRSPVAPRGCDWDPGSPGSSTDTSTL